MLTVHVGRWRIGVLLGLLSLIVIAAVAILAPRPDSALANPATDIVSLTSGTNHTCALTSAGGVKCWGDNNSGMVGDGTETNRSMPTDVVGLTSGVTAVAAGTNHTCALTDAGGVKCWGLNFYGQLGSGTPDVISTLAIDVVGLTSGVTVIGSGASHSCAVTTANDVKCWGKEFGTAPVAIPSTSDVTQIVSGNTHTCALTNTGGVKCWGNNTFGELGNGTRTPSTVPVDVLGLSGVVALAQSSAGATEFSCALLATADVQCWGRNHFGQLGSSTGELLCGGSPCSTVPVSVPGLNPNVVGVAIGTHTACAATATTVQCWGSSYGSAATDVPGFSGSIIGVTRGTEHGCVWTGGGEADCWGVNGRGQLGDGTNNSSLTPVAVVELAAKPTATPTPCAAGGCPTPEPTPGCASPACMALAVKKASGDILCRSDDNATCLIAFGEEFTLTVLATKPPGGYVLAQAWIDYGSALGYMPAPVPADETSWPDASFSTRFFRPDAVYLGALTSIIPPHPVSLFAGELFAFSFACTSTPSSTEVRLLPYLDPVATTFGALYSEPGGAQVIPEVGSLDINCVDWAATGDTDGDGCVDIREFGTDETLGGLRNPLNEWDYYDINGDLIIDLSNDIFDVIQHYAPTGTEPEYDVAFDRGPSTGPGVWSMTAPDGVIDLSNDIFGVIQQYLHSCQ